MDFISTHQLNVMLFMSGCCAILAIMTLMPKFMSRRRRIILALMEASCTLLLLFDRFAYQYRGDLRAIGLVMTRLSNGMCYFLMIFIPFLVTQFLRDMYRNEGRLKKLPRRLILCDALFFIGVTLLIVSQFTGLYYTFDAQNQYQRAAGNFISYIVPFSVILIQESVIIQYRSRIKRNLVKAMILCIALPTIASIIQFFVYGISFISITMVLVVIVFYVYVLCSLGEEVEAAKNHELEVYRAARQRENILFEETTESLANAIDAKDKYTHGHSARVAIISRKIAEEAGFSDVECNNVYFAALLHDVGKIGVRDDVINKHGKLNSDEYNEIKLHPVFGDQILASIKESPYLRVGAHYHHERYDGTGYPDGISGENIPAIARIIAVADAYDAMTSTRSYRAALSATQVRQEIVNGKNKQFDGKFADIMLHLIDSGKVDRAKE